MTINGSNPISKFTDLPIEEIKKKFLICYRHFKKTDYKNPISRSLNITAIPSLNLKDLSQLNLCKQMEVETVKIQSSTIEQKIINSPALTPQTGATISVFEENKNEPESYFVYENESIELITHPLTASLVTKPQQVFPKIQSTRTRRRESPQEVNKDVKKVKVELVPIQYPKPTYENRSCRTLDTSFSETKDSTEETSPSQKSNSTIVIQKSESKTVQPENANKLLALFEVTPDQYKILSNKLSSGSENEALFNFAQEGDENTFKNYGKNFKDSGKLKIFNLLFVFRSNRSTNNDQT